MTEASDSNWHQVHDDDHSKKNKNDRSGVNGVCDLNNLGCVAPSPVKFIS